MPCPDKQTDKDLGPRLRRPSAPVAIGEVWSLGRAEPLDLLCQCFFSLPLALALDLVAFEPGFEFQPSFYYLCASHSTSVSFF